MANIHFYETMLNKVSQKLITANGTNTNDHMDFTKWEWPVGVALYALYKYSRSAGRRDVFNVLADWYDRRFSEGLPEKNVNTVAPLLTLIHLYEELRDKRYLDVCREWATWIMEDMPRTEEGGLQHVTAGADNEGQLWADTLFMTVLFLAKMGKVTGRTDFLEEAVYQFLLHVKYLHDPETGLWFHGWSFAGRHAFGKNRWARGNCWFTAGVVEFLEIAGPPGGVRRYLIETLRAQANALERLQAPDGMWHTLLDDASSYVETSATAGFGYGILKAVRLGLLDRRFLAVGRKAADAVLSRIAEDGTVLQVSYGTNVGMDADHYRNIPVCPTAYGQALVMMLLTELIVGEGATVK